MAAVRSLLTKTGRAAGALMLSALAVVPAQAKVEHQGKNGFAVVHESVVAASPERIWQAVLKPYQWWSGAHSWSGSAANFSMDPRQGGCFCEALPNGGFVEHARVIHVAHEKMMRLSGALGPLQSEALAGTLTITLKPVEQGTSLRFEYVVGGYARFDLRKIAPAVDAVIGEQQGRLARLAGTGSADAPSAAAK